MWAVECQAGDVDRLRCRKRQVPWRLQLCAYHCRSLRRGAQSCGYAAGGEAEDMACTSKRSKPEVGGSAGSLQQQQRRRQQQDSPGSAGLVPCRRPLACRAHTCSQEKRHQQLVQLRLCQPRGRLPAIRHTTLKSGSMRSKLQLGQLTSQTRAAPPGRASAARGTDLPPP